MDPTQQIGMPLNPLAMALMGAGQQPSPSANVTGSSPPPVQQIGMPIMPPGPTGINQPDSSGAIGMPLSPPGGAPTGINQPSPPIGGGPAPAGISPQSGSFGPYQPPPPTPPSGSFGPYQSGFDAGLGSATRPPFGFGSVPPGF